MKNIEEFLKENNQEHIIDYLNNATKEQKDNLIKQIESIDFELSNKFRFRKKEKFKSKYDSTC